MSPLTPNARMTRTVTLCTGVVLEKGQLVHVHVRGARRHVLGGDMLGGIWTTIPKGKTSVEMLASLIQIGA